MERDFNVRCKKCDQSFRFTVTKNGVDDISFGNAYIALTLSRTLKIEDPDIASVVLGESEVKRDCPADFPFGHTFDFPTPAD